MPGPIPSIASLPIASLRPEAAELLAGANLNRAGGGFGAALAHAIAGVENIQRAGAEAVGKFLSGDNQELHATVLAVQRADLAFDLFLQVRNKVVAAYQEIMRMQD